MPEDIKTQDGWENKIVEAIAVGTLFDLCGDCEYGDRVIIQKTLIALHNSKRVNVIDEFAKPMPPELSGPKVYSCQIFLVKLLPFIEDDVERVAQCILKYESNPHCNSQMSVEAMIAFCKQRAERPQILLELSFNQQPLKRFLAIALIAGMSLDLSTYLTKTIDLIEKNPDAEIQELAMDALRDAAPLTSDVVERIINCIDTQLNSSASDMMLSRIFLIAKKLYRVEEYKDKGLSIFESGLEFTGECARYGLALMLSIFGADDKAIVSKIFMVLCATNPAAIRIIDAINMNVYSLLKNGHLEPLLDFIEHVVTHQEDIRIEEKFPNFVQNVCNNTSLLNQVTTRWLAHSSHLVRSSAVHLILQKGLEPFSIAMDATLLHNKIDLSLLAKRTAGYLYPMPTQCVSFLISIFKEANSAQKDDIYRLLADPLMLSFPDIVRNTIESSLPNLPQCDIIHMQKMLADDKIYTDELLAIRKQTQLGPSESQKEICREKHKKWNQDVTEAAHERSVFAALCTKVVFLYPGRFFSRAKPKLANGSNEQRNEMPMYSFSQSIPIPLLSVFDPLYEQYELLHLQHNREHES